MAPLSVARLVEPTVAELVDVVEIFDRYRSHYGEPVTPGRTLEWLQQQAGRGRLTVFTARLGAGLVGFATTVETPASLRLGHYWQLRDLYVAPDARRSGVGRALLAAVERAAGENGALRLSVQTESENAPALQLYRSSGFTRVAGYEVWMLSL